MGFLLEPSEPSRAGSDLCLLSNATTPGEFLTRWGRIRKILCYAEGVTFHSPGSRRSAVAVRTPGVPNYGNPHGGRVKLDAVNVVPNSIASDSFFVSFSCSLVRFVAEPLPFFRSPGKENATKNTNAHEDGDLTQYCSAHPAGKEVEALRSVSVSWREWLTGRLLS